MYNIIDFPKIHSPFIREKKPRRQYLLTNEFEDGYSWLYDDGVIAVDKLNGTNICVYYDAGKITHISNRKQLVLTDNDSFFGLKGNNLLIAAGLLNSMKKGIFQIPGAREGSGRIYGELISPKINKNIHCVDSSYFIPFDYLKDKCHWHSWVQNKYPKNFESISEWFKELPSLFTKRFTGRDEPAEGLVFYHPDGKMCKLRRDMFEWY